MFRVSRAAGPLRTVVTIDGHLSRQVVEAVETCCTEAASEGRPVHLYLRDVLTVDDAGRALLRRLVAKGIRLMAKGIYTSYLVRALCRRGEEDGEAASIQAIHGKTKARDFQ